VSDALPLAGRVALIAGAAGPFGRAIAVALAEAGAELVLTTSSRAGTEEFAINSIGNELWALDRRYLALVVDADDPASIAEALDRTLSELGRIDFIVADAVPPARAERFCRCADEAMGPSGVAVLLFGDETSRQRALADEAAQLSSHVTLSGVVAKAGASPAGVAAQVLQLCIAARERSG